MIEAIPKRKGYLATDETQISADEIVISESPLKINGTTLTKVLRTEKLLAVIKTYINTYKMICENLCFICG